MDQYRTSGTMNEDTLREFSKYMIPSRSKWLALLFVLCFGGAAALNFAGGNTVMTVICTLGVVVFLVEIPLLKRRFLRNNIARLRENYPDGSCRYESFFTIDGIQLHNLSNGGETLLRYESFAQAAEKAGTISYELLCALARRVPRVYLRGGEAVEVVDYLGQA